MGYRWKPWEKGFQTSHLPLGNSLRTLSSGPSNPGTPQCCQTRQKGPPSKNCLSFQPRTSRIPLGDGKSRNGHCKEKFKGFPMIPSFLANSPPVWRSGALKLPQGHVFPNSSCHRACRKPWQQSCVQVGCGYKWIRLGSTIVRVMLHATGMVSLASPYPANTTPGDHHGAQTISQGKWS